MGNGHLAVYSFCSKCGTEECDHERLVSLVAERYPERIVLGADNIPVVVEWGKRRFCVGTHSYSCQSEESCEGCVQHLQSAAEAPLPALSGIGAVV